MCEVVDSVRGIFTEFGAVNCRNDICGLVADMFGVAVVLVGSVGQSILASLFQGCPSPFVSAWLLRGMSLYPFVSPCFKLITSKDELTV